MGQENKSLKNLILSSKWEDLPTLLSLQWKNAIFIIGESMKILKVHFCQQIIIYINTSPQYTKRCEIATFGGLYFLGKVDIVNILCQKSGFRCLRLQ